MNAQPIFSIIIPTYNRASRLKRCLDKIQQQTYKNFEVLVCDDGSTDNTAEIVAGFTGKLDLRYFRSENWGGPAKPRNTGITNARGEWLCFLDSDDWWYETRLEKTLSYCNMDNDLIYIDFDLYKNEQPLNIKHKGRTLRSPVFEDLFINDNCIVNSGVCVRKELLVRAGGFLEDKALIAVEDYDLWLRCARLTEKFRYAPHTLGAYEHGDDNISMQHEVQLKRIAILFDRHIPFLRNAASVKAAETNWSYKKALICLKAGNIKEAKKLFHVSKKSNRLLIRLKSIYRLINLTGK